MANIDLEMGQFQKVTTLENKDYIVVSLDNGTQGQIKVSDLASVVAGVIGVFTSSSNGLMDKNLKPMYLDFYNTNRCIKAFKINNNSSELVFLYAAHHVHNSAYSLRICEINYNENAANRYFNSTILLGASNEYEEMYINDNLEVYAQTSSYASLFILPLCGFNYSLINEQSEKLDLSSLTRLI